MNFWNHHRHDANSLGRPSRRSGRGIALVWTRGPEWRDRSSRVARVQGVKTQAFSPLINRVMGQLAGLRLATVPLLAPAGSLTPLGWPLVRYFEYQGRVFKSSPAGAWLQATQSSYVVSFAACAPLGPPQVHTVVGTSCTMRTADEDQLGSTVAYGARRYSTHARALALMKTALHHEPAVAARSSEVGPAVPVALGDGIVGTEHTSASSWCRRSGACGGVVEWAVGQWRFIADFLGCPSNTSSRVLLPTARAMVALARSHPLPTEPGLVDYGNSCGDPTSLGTVVTWAEGTDVYSTWGGTYKVPMLLAARMQPYEPGPDR